MPKKSFAIIIGFVAVTIVGAALSAAAQTQTPTGPQGTSLTLPHARTQIEIYPRGLPALHRLVRAATSTKRDRALSAYALLVGARMIHRVAVSTEVRTTRTALAACSKNVWPRADVAQARRRPKQPIKPALEAVHSVIVAP